MSHFALRVRLALALAAASRLLPAQQPQPAAEPRTRHEYLAWERAEKQRQLRPDVPGKAERISGKINKRSITDKLLGDFPGLRLKMGGLYTGSGFGLGLEYYRPDLANGNVVFRSTAVGSFRRYYLLETYAGLPRIASNHFSVDATARHLDAPMMPYYGPGIDSNRDNRSNFRKEETSFDVKAGWRPMRRTLLAGFTAGYLALNVGPGKDRRYISSDLKFPPLDRFLGGALAATNVPGLHEQTNFVRIGPFIELDLRDSPKDPHSGSHLHGRYTYYRDGQFSRYSFRRLEAGAEHYLPFLNNKRVIALRAKTELSYRNSGQLVPFYLQPSLGGSDDLRGYRQFRYYDNNLLVANAEYRWEAFPALDMALFVDAGKVFNRMREFDVRRLRSSAGFGFRFKSRDKVVLRTDVGFSREGFQVWFKFNNVF